MKRMGYAESAGAYAKASGIGWWKP